MVPNLSNFLRIVSFVISNTTVSYTQTKSTLDVFYTLPINFLSFLEEMLLIDHPSK